MSRACVSRAWRPSTVVVSALLVLLVLVLLVLLAFVPLAFVLLALALLLVRSLLVLLIVFALVRLSRRAVPSIATALLCHHRHRIVLRRPTRARLGRPSLAANGHRQPQRQARRLAVSRAVIARARR